LLTIECIVVLNMGVFYYSDYQSETHEEPQINFLTPKSFNRFFIQLRNNEAIGFRSELDVVLNDIATKSQEEN